jgi:hypothetical protein
MSAALHIIGKDPASMPDQSDAEVVAFVSTMVGDDQALVLSSQALGFVLQGVISATSTSGIFVAQSKANSLYQAHRAQLNSLLSQAWEQKSFETIRRICLSSIPMHYAIGITDVRFSYAPQNTAVLPHRNIGAGTKCVSCLIAYQLMS